MEPSARGPVRTGERSLAPDLARGIALLGIALANSVLHVHGQPLGPGYRPVDGSTADRVVDLVVGLFVDNRAFPMFTLLFAYGLVMLSRRQAEAGTPVATTRRLLFRRCAWLGAFGLAHLLLLFDGDILLLYGLLGLVLVPMLRMSDRVLLVVAAAALIPFVAASSFDGLAGVDRSGPLPFDGTTLLGAFGQRVVQGLVSLVASPVVVLAFLTPGVLGVLLARRQVLERPAAHLRLLRWTALVGLPVSVLGALPMVLATVQVWTPSTPAGLLTGALHAVTGLAGSLAFIAIVGLVVAAREGRGDASRVSGGLGGVVSALAAVGRRSLTCYLLQSLIFVPLMAPWAGGLGVGAGTAFAAAVGVGAYLAGVVLAVGLERAGRPGPAEVLLRRLTYGRRPPGGDRRPAGVSGRAGSPAA